MSKIVDLFLLYKFIRKLTKPFSEWDAYKLGVIDSEGNVLVPKEKRTLDQKDSFRKLDVVVRNIKRLLAKVPGGTSRLASIGAALYLLKEDINEETSDSELTEKIKLYMDSALNEGYNELEKNLFEDAPVNATGPMISGINKDDTFAKAKVFEVEDDAMWNSRFGRPKYSRWKKYVGEGETGNQIKQFAQKNPKSDIVLKNSKTGAMMFLRREEK